ncbi:hypothetical protein [Caballeronia sp. ATUFL_M1_KS5A]|uniref:hypothetical protein n=1 Tax=Caballeronia sp. ATUFL_M1_KS5A TaxID=2921778 RepID=UPI0020289F37|nr:hypothetical protein [Caballeronia sp. ATUFL_M1_KS5A]
MYNGAGVFQLVAGNPVVTGTVISSTWANNTLADIANNGLSNCITKDGQQTVTANIPFNNQRLTGVGNAVNLQDATTATQVQNGSLVMLSTISGTDTITAAATPAPQAYVAGQIFNLVAAGANATTGVTLNISSLGAKNVKKMGPNGFVQLSPGDIQSGQPVTVIYDGTQFVVLSLLPPNAPTPGSNKIVNSNFDIWQRGTSFTNATTAANAYTADCWQAYRTSFTGGYTATRITGPTNSTFAIRIQRNAGDASAANIFLGTSFETVNVQKWAGKTFNLSIQALGNGAFVGAAMTALASFGTGTDGNASSGPTGTTSSISQSFTLSGAYQRFDLAVPIPSNATQCMLSFAVAPTGTAGAADFVQYAQVQFTEGASVLPYERRDTRWETRDCRWFYKILTEAAFYGYGNPGQLMGYGLPLEPMRTAPSVTINTVGYTNCSALAAASAPASNILLYASVTAAGPAAWDASNGIVLNASL